MDILKLYRGEFTEEERRKGTGSTLISVEGDTRILSVYDGKSIHRMSSITLHRDRRGDLVLEKFPSPP